MSSTSETSPDNQRPINFFICEHLTIVENTHHPTLPNISGRNKPVIIENNPTKILCAAEHTIPSSANNKVMDAALGLLKLADPLIMSSNYVIIPKQICKRKRTVNDQKIAMRQNPEISSYIRISGPKKKKHSYSDTASSPLNSLHNPAESI